MQALIFFFSLCLKIYADMYRWILLHVIPINTFNLVILNIRMFKKAQENLSRAWFLSFKNIQKK